MVQLKNLVKLLVSNFLVNFCPSLPLCLFALKLSIYCSAANDYSVNILPRTDVEKGSFGTSNSQLDSGCDLVLIQICFSSLQSACIFEILLFCYLFTSCQYHVSMIFTRDSIAGSAYMLRQFRPSVCLSVCLSVRPSVCPSHGWISQKRLKLRSCSFHHTVAPSL